MSLLGQVAFSSSLLPLHTGAFFASGAFLPPGAFLPELELLNINKDYQLVEEGEGGEEAQLWGEAILGAAILPQLQEADSGRYLDPYIYSFRKADLGTLLE